MQSSKRSFFWTNRATMALTVLAVSAIGVTATYFSQAATPNVTFQPESGVLTGGAVSVTDSTASGGRAVHFGSASPVPTVASKVGISIPGYSLMYLPQAALDADMARVTAAGAKWIRFDFAASEMEAIQGQTVWTNADRVVASARAHGLSISGVISTMPVWARTAGTDWRYGPQTDAQRAAFADFARRAALRYDGKVSAWEVWNEPNLDQFWLPLPNIATYTRLLQATYPVLKQASPNTPVLTGGTGWSGGGLDIGTIAWYTGLYSNGGKGYFDAMNVHPYMDFSFFPGGELAIAKQVRGLMDAQGDTTKELWGTETGAPTGGQSATSEANQGALLPRTYDYWISIHHHGPLFWYELRDQGGTDREGHFGLLRQDNSPKPAHTALESWASGR